MNRTFQAIALTFLLGLFTAQSAYLAITQSTVSDEVAHIGAGYSYLKYHDYRLNMEHPPLVKQIAAVPLLFMNLQFPTEIPAWKEGDGEQWTVGRAFLFKLGNPAQKIIFSARMALLPLALLLGLALFFFVREQLGPPTALFCVFLFALTPDLVLHSSLVTTDFAAAAFFFMTFYFLLKNWESGENRFLVGAGLSAGLALLSKFSMMQILPLIALFSLSAPFLSPAERAPIRFPLAGLILTAVIAFSDKTSLKIFILPLLFLGIHRFFPGLPVFRSQKLNRSAGIFLFLLIIAFAVIALGYFEPAFWFEKFRPLKRFFRGWAIFSDHSTQLQHPGYLFGNYSHRGWPYYYLVAMLVKIPLPILIFSLAGFIHSVHKKLFSLHRWIFLLLPPLFFFFIASFINHVNIGVRHVLPVYPFLLVFAAAGFHSLWTCHRKLPARAAVIVLSLWLICSVTMAFPNYIPYFNEMAKLWGGGDRILSDSNISWGQTVRPLRDYVRHNNIKEIKILMPFNFSAELDYYKIPWKQGEEDFLAGKPGLYAVDATVYQKLVRLPQFQWLRTRRPDNRLSGTSLLIYHFD